MAVRFCLSKFLCKRNFDRILDFFADSEPRYTADRGTANDKPGEVGPCKGPRGTLHSLEVSPHWGLLRF